MKCVCTPAQLRIMTFQRSSQLLSHMPLVAVHSGTNCLGLDGKHGIALKVRVRLGGLPLDQFTASLVSQTATGREQFNVVVGERLLPACQEYNIPAFKSDLNIRFEIVLVPKATTVQHH